MASRVELANWALDKVGEQPIISLSDPQKGARVTERMFDKVRDRELRARKWSFSIKRVQLAPDVDVPVYGYGSQFTLPSDCLRVLSIFNFDIGPNMSDYNSGMSQTYVIEGRKILYGRPIPGGPPPSFPMPLRYIAKIEDTTQWDASFCEVFACRLAMEIAETITQSDSKFQKVSAQYQEALGAAKRANALELPSDTIADDTWVFGRLRG